MPSTSTHVDPLSYQPAARHLPKPPDSVLAEKEAQWLFTDEELARTPSIEDGMLAAQEQELRSKGLHFIMQVAIMLKLPQLTLSTAGIFFNRFLMRYSLVKTASHPKPLHHFQIAATALFLSTKTTETPRKLKELITAVCRVAQKNPALTVHDDSKDFWRWRDTLLFNEDVLLETLCFDVSPTPPHRALIDLLRFLRAEEKPETYRPLRNAAWAFCNDTGMTSLSLRYGPRVLAAAAVYAGAKYAGPDCAFDDDEYGRPWWTVMGVKLQHIRDACNVMADLYEADPEKLSSEETGVYVGLRTPIDGAEGIAKTRVRLESAPSAMTGGDPGAGEGFEQPALLGTEVEELEKRETAEREHDQKAQQQSTKREASGTRSQPSPTKRIKTQTNGHADVENHDIKMHSEGSEEGEVDD